MRSIIEIDGNAMGRDFIGTDPHGSLDELKKVVGLLKTGDRLFLCGDYIDRGKKSLEVIRYLKKQKKSGKQIFMIRGNHEDMMLKTLQDIELVIAMRKGAYLFGDWESWKSYCESNASTCSWCKDLTKQDCILFLKSYSKLTRAYSLQFQSANEQEYERYEEEIKFCLQGLKNKYEVGAPKVYDFFLQLVSNMNNGEAWALSLSAVERAEVKGFLDFDVLLYGLRVKEVQQEGKAIKGFDLFHAAPLSEGRIQAVLLGEALTDQEKIGITWARPYECAQIWDLHIDAETIGEKLHRTYLGHTVEGADAGSKTYQAIKAFNLDVGTADSGCMLVYDHTNDRIHVIGALSPAIEEVIKALNTLAQSSPSYSYSESTTSEQKLNDEICKKIWTNNLSRSQLKQAFKEEIKGRINNNAMSAEQRKRLAHYLLTHSQYHILAEERGSCRGNEYSIKTQSMSDVIDILLNGLENNIATINRACFQKDITFFNASLEPAIFTIKNRI